MHPYDRASASGEWVLHVDPSQRYGAGPARYRVTHAGRVAWEAEQPFTFQDACVASDGSVVGVGITTGSSVVQALVAGLEGDLEGELVLAILAPDGTVLGSERTPRTKELCPFPSVDRLDLFEAQGCAVLVVSARGRPTEWWVYSVSTGTPLGRFGDPPAFMTDLPRCKSMPCKSTRTHEPPTQSLSELPEVQLHPRGSRLFEAPDAAERYLLFGAQDSFGRLVFLDQKKFEALVFDRSGGLLWIARPEPEDLGRHSHLLLWAGATADGGLLVRVQKGLIEFGPDGTRIGITGEGSYVPPERVGWQGSRECWELDLYHGRIERLDEQGRAERTLLRGANDRWLRRLTQPSAANDGSLAVLDQAYDGRDLWLHIFSATGQPLVSVELPPSWMGPLAFDGHRVVLLHDKELAFIEADGTISGRAALPELDDPYPIAFSPEGVLWVFTGETRHDYDVL